MTLFESLTNYEAVLFDLDGVLINSDQAWIMAIQYVLKEEDLLVPSVQTIEQNLALSTEGQLKIFFPEKENDPSYLLNLTRKIDHYYLLHIPENVILVERSIELLEAIKELRIKLGVVTNNGGEVTTSILEVFKLTSYFESIIHLDDVGKPKPDPSSLLKSIENLDVDKNSVLFVGDSPSDLEASLRAKIAFILIKNPKSSFVFPEIPKNVKIFSGLGKMIP